MLIRDENSDLDGLNGWKPMAHSGLEALVGQIYARREGNGWAYGFLAEDRHRNGQGIVHGGVLMAFADHCVGMSVWEAAGRQPSVTVQLNTHFVSAAQIGEFIECRGEIVRSTASMTFVRGALTADGRAVASVDGIWKRVKRAMAKHQGQRPAAT